MTIHEAYKQLLAQLYEIYDNREAANIADLVFEYVTGQQKIDRIMYKEMKITKEQSSKLETLIHQLLKHKPVQYVLNECWFAGMKLYVDEDVLIPRPETEELVEWIVNSEIENRKSKIENQKTKFKIIDVGTGSGCIAITLKNKISLAEIIAIDISKEALAVASKNAKEQRADIQFLQMNFLNKDEWNQLETFDIIVSNPPYVRKNEAGKMNKNVLMHEPHTALFVPDEDALIFYHALAKFGKEHLKQEGNLFMEINEDLGDEVSKLFYKEGYKNIEVKKDMQGKDRMVKAW